MAALKQPPSAQSIEQIRTKARRRLIGAIILVVLAVAILPWLFDSHPREAVVDIPIQITGQANHTPNVVLHTTEPVIQSPEEYIAPPQFPQLPEEGGHTIPISVQEPAQEPPTQHEREIVETPGSSEVEPKPNEGGGGEPIIMNNDEGHRMGLYAIRPANRRVIPSKFKPIESSNQQEAVTDAQRAAALLGEDNLANSAPTAKPSGLIRPASRPNQSGGVVSANANSATSNRSSSPRPAAVTPATSTNRASQATSSAAPVNQANQTRKYVIQVGSYADAAKVSEVRARLTMAGYTSYTQEVQTGAAKLIRVRIGPFKGKDAADKVAEKIRAMGFQVSVLPA